MCRHGARSTVNEDVAWLNVLLSSDASAAHLGMRAASRVMSWHYSTNAKAPSRMTAGAVHGECFSHMDHMVHSAKTLAFFR